MFCPGYVSCGSGEALVVSSPFYERSFVLRQYRDTPRWMLLGNVKSFPTDVMSAEVISESELSGDAIPLSLISNVKYRIRSETDSDVLAAAERFWTREENGIRETAAGIVRDIQGSSLSAFTIQELRQEISLFVQKVKDGIRREFQDLGLVLEGYAVKDLFDHVGYLQALDSIKIADVVKKSRLFSAEEELKGVIDASSFKLFVAERALNHEKSQFEKENRPKLDELRKLIMNEINRANSELDPQLHVIQSEKHKIVAEKDLEINQAIHEVDIEWEDILRTQKEKRLLEVYEPANEEKSRLENEAKRYKNDQILEAQKEAEAIVLSGESKARSLIIKGYEEVERIRKLSECLKNYSMSEFVSALKSCIEESEGPCTPFIVWIVNILNDYQKQNEGKSCKKLEKEIIATALHDEEIPLSLISRSDPLCIPSA